MPARTPVRPAPGSRVMLILGETSASVPRALSMTIEEADQYVSELIGRPVEMRFHEDVRVGNSYVYIDDDHTDID